MAYTRVHRLLKIITLIHGSAHFNPAKLVEMCCASERNIYRDIKQLQGAGVPISFDKEAGGYSVRGDFFLRPVDLTLEEAMAPVIVSSHLLALVQDLCTHLLILHHGRRLFFGPVEEAKAAFANVSGDTSLEEMFFRATEGEAVTINAG